MFRKNGEQVLSWQPFAHQHFLIHMDRIRAFSKSAGVPVSHVCCHRRGGKSTGAAYGVQKEVAKILAEDSIFKINDKIDSYDPKIAYLAHTKTNARNIIWGLFQRTLSIFPGAKLDSQRLVITIPRPNTGDTLEILLMSLRDHNNIRGMKLRMIFIDEAQTMLEAAFQQSIYSTLVDVGGVLSTMGTATSLGYYPKMIKDAIRSGIFVAVIPVTKTNVFSKDRIRAIREELDEAHFEQEYMCNFSVSSVTAFWESTLSKLEQNRRVFQAAEFTGKNVRVLACDDGVDKGFCAWLVEVDPYGKYIDVLDFYTGYQLLEELRMDLLSNYGLPDAYIIPHDSKKRRLEAKVRRTTRDVFKETFPESRPIILSKPGNKMAEISMTHENLHMLRFPSEMSETDAWIGLQLLKQFRRKPNAQGAASSIVHKGDGSDHAADALIHLFQGLGVKKGCVTTMPRFKIGGVSPVKFFKRNRTHQLMGLGEEWESVIKGV